MSRSSVHDPISKSYAIDQIDDIEHLRTVAHRMWEAFYASQIQTAHAIAALTGNGCEKCHKDFLDLTGPATCDEWKAWQAKVIAGFGTV